MKKNLGKKLTAVVLSVLMVLMTAVPAFADDSGIGTILDFFGGLTPEDIAEGPNLFLFARCSNPDCTVFPDAGDMTVVISHDGMEDIAVPVEKIEADGEGIGFWIGAERIEQAILDEMAAIQGAILEEELADPEEEDTEPEEDADKEGDAEPEDADAEPEAAPQEEAPDAAASEAASEEGEEADDPAVDAAPEENGGEAAPAAEPEETAGDAEPGEPGAEDLTPEELAEAVEDIYDLLSGYSFTLQGENADHYTISGEDRSGFLLTHDIFELAVATIAWLYEDELGEEVDSFAELLQPMLDEMGDDLSEEERAAFEKLIENIDPLMEFLCSTDFGGILIVDLWLDCGCAESTLFRIEHQYYRKNGDKLEFVGSVDEFYDESEDVWLDDEDWEEDGDGYAEEDEEEYEDWEDEDWEDDDEPWPEDDSEDGEEDERFGPVGYGEAMTGDTVYAKDYIRPEYNGETYEYTGSYELYKTQTAEVVEFEGMGETHTYYWDAFMTEAGEWDAYAADSLVLGEWWAEEYEQGLVLVYVIEDEEFVPTSGAVDKCGAFEPAPNTGDPRDFAAWITLLAYAAACAGALALRRRRG